MEEEPCPSTPMPPCKPVPPKLSELHLWRVQPSQASLYRIIRPFKGQKPIVMIATRMSGRKMVLGIWAVADGEAISISVYDPKAVETLELTLICGWWAELGLPSLNIMTTTDLDGLAAYVTQGISLKVPQPDLKGRVDMSKASLQFNPGSPPPPIDFDPTRFTPRNASGMEALVAVANTRRVVWRGFRRFGRRAVLLACARDGPSVIIVRGWDSSMAWRMTNLVTFYHDEWKHWPELWAEQRPAKNLQTHPGAPVAAADGDTCGTNGEDGGDKAEQPTGAVPNHPTDFSVDANDSHDISQDGRKYRGHQIPLPAVPTKEAGTDRLCQVIADRVRIVREGGGGKIALSAVRSSRVRSGDGEDEGPEEGPGGRRGNLGFVGGLVGGGEVEEAGKDVKAQRAFLSHEHMERRVQELDRKTSTSSSDNAARKTMSEGPRRPLEDSNDGFEAMRWMRASKIFAVRGAARVFARQRGVDKRLRTMDEVVEQLRKDAKEKEKIAQVKRLKAIQQWKSLGKVLCRLLRMSDYWYGFVADDTLTHEERTVRRISVLQQVVEVRVAGAGRMKTLVMTFAERYPEAIWTKFRLLMRQPKSQRCRRDMCVCAMLLSDIDNSFFKHTTAGWPFSRLVKLITDTRLVEKPALAVLYEEGEPEEKLIGGEVGWQVSGGKVEGVDAGGEISGGRGGGLGGGIAGGKGEQEGAAAEGPKERWTVGAYVIMRGAVDLYVFERGAAAGVPTAAFQEHLAKKAARGQPMYCPRTPAECETRATAASSLDGELRPTMTDIDRLARRRQEAVVEEVEAALSGSGAGPRRPRTLNLSPRYKTCRLGPGALFGDRPTSTGRLINSSGKPTFTNATTCGDNTNNGQTPRAITASGISMGSSSIASLEHGETGGGGTDTAAVALETAVTATKVEILEIGVAAYRSLLAHGVQERVGAAVDVLKATAVMDGVPVSALERICRYATDRTAGCTVEHSVMPPPFLNPGGTMGRSQPQESNNRQTMICCRGALRRTAFFIAEGEGEVFVNNANRDLGCSSAGTLLGSRLGGGDLSRSPKRRRRGRQKHASIRGGDSMGDIIVVGGSNRTLGPAPPERPSSGEADDRVAFVGYERVKDCQSTVKAAGVGDTAVEVDRAGSSSTGRVDGGCNGDEWWNSEGGKGTAVAVLRRGDFFGVAPELQTTQEPLSIEESASMASISQVVDVGMPASSHPDFKSPPSSSASSEFPGLHKASLLAGARGVRCMAVSLVVLHRVCPPVYRRLATAAGVRYAGWMEEAERRHEDEWSERLENESVRCLSPSFYKAHCRGGDSEQRDLQVSLSTVGTSVDDEDRSSVGLGDSSTIGYGGGSETSGKLFPAPPARPMNTNRGIFDLRGTFRRLTSCSSARNVIPVRLGQALPQTSQTHHKRSFPPPGFDCSIESGEAAGGDYQRTTHPSSSSVVVATAVAAADSSVPVAGDAEHLRDLPAAAICTTVANTSSEFSNVPLSSLITPGSNGPRLPPSSPQRLSPTDEAAHNRNINRAPVPVTIENKHVYYSPPRGAGRVSAVGIERRKESGLQRSAINTTRAACSGESGERRYQQSCQEGGPHALLLPPSDQHLELWWDYPVSPFSPPPRWATIALAGGSDPPLITASANIFEAVGASRPAITVVQPQKPSGLEKCKHSSAPDNGVREVDSITATKKGNRGYRKGFGCVAGGSRGDRRRRGGGGFRGDYGGRTMHGVLPPTI